MGLRSFIAALAVLAAAGSLSASDGSAPPAGREETQAPDGGSADPDGSAPAGEGAPARPAATENVTVTASRPISAASEGTVRERDLSLRPLASPSDVLRVVPGLVVAQHAGGGKADQIFLRGFDADHGTDVALGVDGVPANLVSHAHGQGYADLHWVIPETLSGAETRKGTYFADQGDFGTAGSVNFLTRERFDAASFQAQAGSFGARRLLAAGSPPAGPFATVLAAEGLLAAGPFDHPQDLTRLNLFAKLSRRTSETRSLTLTATAYRGSWNASGQIPERAVAAGDLDRFGAVDPTEGGTSHRHSLAAIWSETPTPLSARRFQAYAVDYGLDLFSNFTFFANDPVRGDGIEQVDRRRYYGAAASQRWILPADSLLFETTLGAQLRFDDAEVSLFRQQEHERLGVVNDAVVRETGAGIYVQEDVSFGARLRGVAAIRYDAFLFEVDSRLPAGAGPVRSGEASEGILQPKASLIVSLARDADLFLNYGAGFHSNDARATVINEAGSPALPRAEGYELGVRARPGESEGRLDLAASLWRLDLQNEYVYVGDEGGTELRGASRRQGIEIEARARLGERLWADADYALSSARFTETGDAVPLAPRRIAAAGLTIHPAQGIAGSLRVRYLGSRPAVEDGSFRARGHAVLDARIRHARGAVECFLDLDNIAGADFREAQFYNESRLRGEPAPVGDIHFTPGAPRFFRFGIARRF